MRQTDSVRTSTQPAANPGYTRSRWNALTHGLYARKLLLAADDLGEDAAQFQAVREALLKEYAPADLQEERMVERMAVLIWRQDRLFAYAQEEFQEELASRGSSQGDTGERLLRSERMGSVEIRLDRAIYRLHRDLLFLARYRKRTREDDVRRRSKWTVDEQLGVLEAEVQALESRVPTETTKVVGAPEPETAEISAAAEGDLSSVQQESSSETIVSTENNGTDPTSPGVGLGTEEPTLETPPSGSSTAASKTSPSGGSTAASKTSPSGSSTAASKTSLTQVAA